MGRGGVVKIKRACLGLYLVSRSSCLPGRERSADKHEDVDLLGKDKTPVISKPYDPVHVTHVGFDFQTGKCTSLSSCLFRDYEQKTDERDKKKIPVCRLNGNKSSTTMVSPKTSKNETRTASWQSCST